MLELQVAVDNAGLSAARLKIVQKAIKDQWEYFHSAYHGAGFVLNPGYIDMEHISNAGNMRYTRTVIGRLFHDAPENTAQHSSGNRGGYDDAKSERYENPRGLTVGDRAICTRPLLRATQSVPRACIVDLKLASASASARVITKVAWRRTRLRSHRLGENRRSQWRRADPPASTDRRVGRARSRARCDECL